MYNNLLQLDQAIHKLHHILVSGTATKPNGIMIDFFDFSTQSKILQVLLNVGQHSESEADFESHLLPIMGNIC